MAFTRNYLEEACEEIDAAMFSGDSFLQKENRDELMIYINRWLKALPHQEEIANSLDESDED